jgi:hypothetical protein
MFKALAACCAFGVAQASRLPFIEHQNEKRADS